MTSSEQTTIRYGVITRHEQDKPLEHIYAASGSPEEAIERHRKSVADLLEGIEFALREGVPRHKLIKQKRHYSSDAMDIVGVVRRTDTNITSTERLPIEEQQ